MSCGDGKRISFAARPWDRTPVYHRDVLTALPLLTSLREVAKLTPEQVNIFRRAYGNHKITRTLSIIEPSYMERNALLIDIGCSVLSPFTPNSAVGPDA